MKTHILLIILGLLIASPCMAEDAHHKNVQLAQLSLPIPIAAAPSRSSCRSSFRSCLNTCWGRDAAGCIMGCETDCQRLRPRIRCVGR